MKKENIFEIAKKSSIQLWKNPILLVPILFGILLFIAGALGVFLTLLLTGFSLNFAAVDPLGFLVLPSLSQIIIALGISLIIAVAIALAYVHLKVGTLGMIKEIVKGKKTNLKAINNYGQKFWSRYLGVSVLIGLISICGGILIVILIVLFDLLFRYLFKGSTIILLGLSFILILLLVLFILLFTLSPYYLVLEDLGVIQSIKRGYKVAKNNYLELIGLVLIFVLISSVLRQLPYLGLLLSILVGIILEIALMNFAISRR